MSEIVRSVVAKLRRHVADRREEPRVSVRLPFSISVNRGGAENGQNKPPLEGYARDISASSLGLIVHSLRIDSYYIFADGRPLKLVLQLPSGPLTMLVAPLRCERQGESGDAYIVGVRITAVGDDDRRRYLEYLVPRLSRR